jgi:hypothetical protein
MTDLQWANSLSSWPEYPEPNADGWKDCTQASYLDLLVAGGLPEEKFLRGIRTTTERERFEDAEGLPESQQEQGLWGYSRCDRASRALYGVTARDATEAQLPVLLAYVGAAIALTGQGAGLPSRVTVRHSVTFVPIGNGLVRVLDPAYRYIRTARVATILVWHARLPIDIRYVYRDEFKESEMRTSTPRLDAAGNPRVVRATVLADLPHFLIPNDPTQALVAVVAGSTYTGTLRRYDVPVSGGQAGENRLDYTEVVVGGRTFGLLDKDTTWSPIAAGDAVYLVHLSIHDGAPSISLA